MTSLSFILHYYDHTPSDTLVVPELIHLALIFSKFRLGTPHDEHLVTATMVNNSHYLTSSN
jgi:hypothetical protein